MSKTATLRVLPNPFSALDAEGMPAGAVRYDPDVGRPGVVHFVGAEMVREVLDEEAFKGNRERQPRFRRRRTRFTWSQAPVVIPATKYHVERVRAGELLPADKDSARVCRVWFVEPARALAAARDRAITDYRASCGEIPPIHAWDAAVGRSVPASPAPRRAEPQPLAAPFGREVK